MTNRYKNVNLQLKTPRRHIYRVEVQLHAFLTSALDEGKKFLIIKPTRCINFSNLFLE